MNYKLWGNVNTVIALIMVLNFISDPNFLCIFIQQTRESVLTV